MPELSIVIPLFNETDNLDQLVLELQSVIQQIGKPSEIILVDDGSSDGSFDKVRTICALNKNVTGLSLSRNFGHQVALMAGLQQAQGNLIITMDADLQHPPNVIPELLKQHESGFDIVNTRRIDGKETGAFKKVTSKYFYRIINRIAQVNIPEGSSDFRLMSRKALDAFLQFGERDRFTRGLVSWMGFRQTVFPYECPPRFAGKSKYTLRRMLHFAADGITSFSSRPLRIASYMGIIVFLAGLAYAVYAIIQHINGKTIQGWTSLLVTVLLLGGIQLLSIGIIGEYLARIFNESKSRPLYFIKEQING
ncbi:MAG TPA: glycosyltransferase family 2 protein [Bacteroidales bacterium]|nr:glycosyltransferase family 2 protein [Bacteroidales bacterium]